MDLSKHVFDLAAEMNRVAVSQSPRLSNIDIDSMKDSGHVYLLWLNDCVLNVFASHARAVESLTFVKEDPLHKHEPWEQVTEDLWASGSRNLTLKIERRRVV